MKAQHTQHFSAEDAATGQKITAEGFFLYRDCPAGKASAAEFLREFLSGHADFDQCFGAYRVQISLEDGAQVFFSDNAGIMCYFLNGETGRVSSRLMEACAPERREPDYGAIAQFLYFGCIYGLETPLLSVRRSAPGEYYILRDGKAAAHSKNLTPIGDLPYDDAALETHMKRVMRALDGSCSIGCTITGGVDSRAILSHVLANGGQPQLSITENVSEDVRIAQKIAGITGRPLAVYSGKPEGDAWLDEALDAADGLGGGCGNYRLYRQAKALGECGVTLNLGGGAGEIYKNSFINQDFPFYGGKPNWERFLRMKVITYDFPMALCGERLRPEMSEVPGRVLTWLRRDAGKNKAVSYLESGYRLLQCRAITTSNMANRWCSSYAPLLERNVAAWAWHQKPGSLEMQRFQRREVSRNCPALKDVETDRGLTCNDQKRGAEFMKSFSFLVKIGLERIFRHRRRMPQGPSIFTQSHETEQFRRALAVCRKLGILAEDAPESAIPDAVADRLLTIGSLFDGQAS